MRAHAGRATVLTEMISPSLERVQAIYLLSLSDWGKGMGHRSRVSIEPIRYAIRFFAN